MALSCTLYKNTGFNTINIPDSKALLVQDASIQTSVLDCLQNRFLASISVSATWDAVKDVDYVNVDDFYYFVTGITMTSYDIAQISLSPDFITSAGGPTSLSILDGITERHHIAKSADTFGLYDETDPLLSPAQPLLLVFGASAFSDTETDYNIVAESSIDLEAMGKATNYSSKTFGSGDAAVSVPSTTPVGSKNTSFYFGGSSTAHTTTNGTALFDCTNENVLKGLQIVRDLGVENAVIAQYALPKSMFVIGKEASTDGYIRTVTAQVTSFSTNLPFTYATVRNQRVLSGDNNRYGILTASGNSYEANPEQLTGGNLTAPTVNYRGDGRENGMPYFNFYYYMGADIHSLPYFFRNAITGMEWRNVPLTYVTPAHSVQDAVNFRSQQTLNKISNYQAMDVYQQNQAGVDISQAQALGSAIAGMFDSATGTSTSGMISSLVGGINSAISADQKRLALESAEDYRQMTYAVQRRNEMYNFGVSQQVVEPTIKFPFQTPSIRDYAGNGCLTYRYRYSDTDLTRIDKILTAYGYHITEQLDSSMFSNRPHFNFIKATGVTVGGSLPTWWKNGITQQFGSGVRIWHVKPDPAYYTQNE